GLSKNRSKRWGDETGAGRKIRPFLSRGTLTLPSPLRQAQDDGSLPLPFHGRGAIKRSEQKSLAHEAGEGGTRCEATGGGGFYRPGARRGARRGLPPGRVAAAPSCPANFAVTSPGMGREGSPDVPTPPPNPAITSRLTSPLPPAASPWSRGPAAPAD